MSDTVTDERLAEIAERGFIQYGEAQRMACELQRLRPDAKRLDWMEKDMMREEPTAIYVENGKFRFPYMVSNAGGFGGGVGEAAEGSLRAAIDSAMSGDMSE